MPDITIDTLREMLHANGYTAEKVDADGACVLHTPDILIECVGFAPDRFDLRPVNGADTGLTARLRALFADCANIAVLPTTPSRAPETA